MLKKLRIEIIRQLVELNEKLIFNRRLISFYKEKFGENLNCVIDVGANVGQSIDIFLKLNSEVEIFAFEPNPKLFQKLKKKYAS